MADEKPAAQAAEPKPAAQAAGKKPAEKPAEATKPEPSNEAEATYVDKRQKLMLVKDCMAEIRAHEARVRGAYDATRSALHAGNKEQLDRNARAAAYLVSNFSEPLGSRLTDAMTDVGPEQDQIHELAAMSRDLLDAATQLAEAAVQMSEEGVEVDPPNRVNLISRERRRPATVRVFWDGEPGDTIKLSDECTLKAARITRIGYDDFRRLLNQMRTVVEVPAIVAGGGASFYLATKKTIAK